MVAYNDKTWLRRLRRLVEIADQRLWEYRKNRKRMVREYAGSMFANGKRTPLALIYQAVRSMLAQLLYQGQIKSLVRGASPNFDVDAVGLEIALDELFEQIEFMETLNRVALDGCFGPAVLKVGVQPVEGPGPLHDAMQPCADPVDLDDYVIDIQARTREQARFEGNFYFVPADWANECGLFDAAALAKCPRYTGTGGMFSEVTENRTEALSKQTVNKFEAEELQPRYRFCDLWLPQEKVVITVPGIRGAGMDLLLRTMPDDSVPETGPYDVLEFVPVPGSPIGASLVGQFYDLHEGINEQARKLFREASNHKKILAFDSVAAEDAQKIVKANDGEAVPVQSVDRLKEIELGKPVEGRYQTMAWMMAQYENAAGNPSVQSGLKQSADTATQESLLVENSGRTLATLRAKLARFGSSVAGKLAWYLWHAASEPRTVARQEPGLPLQQYEFNGAQGGRDFKDFRVYLDLYSSLPDTPAAKYQRIMDFVQRVLLPGAAAGAGLGYALDLPSLTRLAAKLLDTPELAGAWVPTAPAMVPGPSQPGGGQPAPEAEAAGVGA